MKKPAYPHADAHVLERARMTSSDFAKINAELAQAIKEARERAAEQASGAAATLPPPLVTRGESIKLVIEGGKVKEVLPRVHSEGGTCFIDWVNFTCHESSFRWGAQSVTDEQVIAEVSVVCEAIYGFGITEKRDRGANFYHTSYVLGDKYGMVCYGGQRDTVLVMLNGEGCAAARPGWERRLHDFLNSATAARITRLDLSHDDLEGQRFTPESIEQAYDDGQFNCGGRNPDIELRGNWKSPNGKGRTVYVGNRTNGKFFRGYEKGKQLGDPTSSWVRLEVEFKSVDRVIPFEALLRPEGYFAAAYPLLSTVSSRSERILTVQKTVETSYERTKAWLRHQAGAALHLMNEIEGDASKVLSLIMREGKIPKGITVPNYLNSPPALHTLEKPAIPMAAYYESYSGAH